MCKLPHHAGCSRDGADGTNRRDVLKSLTALGLTAPLATLILDRAAMAGSMSFLDRAELIDGMTALIARANSPELREVRDLRTQRQRVAVEGPRDHRCQGAGSNIPARRPRLAFP